MSSAILALMHQQYGHGLLRSAGVLLLARLFDLTTVVAILLGAAALFLSTPTAQVASLIGALGFALAPFVLLGLGVALLPRLEARLAGSRLGSRLGQRLGAGFARFARSSEPDADGVAALRRIGRGRVRLVVGLGFAIWLAFGLAAVLVAAAVVDTVAPSAALLGAAAGNLAFALPVNGLAGLGPAQAAWVLATTWAGVPRADAIVSALALHAVVLGNALLLGGLTFGCGLGRGRALPGGQPSP